MSRGRVRPKDCVQSDGIGRRLTSASGGRVCPASLDVLPGIAPKKPDPYQHPETKNHQQGKLSPWLHGLRLDRCQVPLREGPHELAIQPNQRQRSNKEEHQGKRSYAYRIKQHHRPMIDTRALRSSGPRLRRSLAGSLAPALHRCLRIGGAGTHQRTRWRCNTHAIQRTMSLCFYTATRSTCTAEPESARRRFDARDNVVTIASRCISYPESR